VFPRHKIAGKNWGKDMGSGAKDYKKRYLFDEDDVRVGRYQLPKDSAAFAKADYDQASAVAEAANDVEDLTVECSECKKPFLWTAQDRKQFYEVRGRRNVYCGPCRVIVKTRFVEN